MSARHFENVRLRNGIGQVSRIDGTVTMPPDETELTAAAGKDSSTERALFHVVETPAPIAVLVQDDRVYSHYAPEELQLIDALLDRGIEVVVRIKAEAQDAAVGECFSRWPDKLDEAACALWALKALGGWNESPSMAFTITQVERVEHGEHATRIKSQLHATIIVTAQLQARRWNVQTRRARARWSNVKRALEARTGSTMAMLVDIDHLSVFNDTYGHREADLMLTRVYGVLASITQKAGAELFRIGGGQYAALLDEAASGDALALAEQLRAAVEGMGLEIEHPESPANRVTVSVGVTEPWPGRDLAQDLDEALQKAKLAGRNTVAAS